MKEEEDRPILHTEDEHVPYRVPYRTNGASCIKNLPSVQSTLPTFANMYMFYLGNTIIATKLSS